MSADGVPLRLAIAAVCNDRGVGTSDSDAVALEDRFGVRRAIVVVVSPVVGVAVDRVASR